MNDKIVVLCGGNSSERDISLLSGEAVYSALLKCGVDVCKIDILNYSLLNLVNEGFNKVFIALHGSDGENGNLQGFLNFLDIPFNGSDLLASALSMDKLRSKILWKGYGLPVPSYVLVSKNKFIDNILDSKILSAINLLGMPVFIKPNCNGSSIGISKANSLDELFLSLKKAFLYDSDVLVEQYLSGPEYTVTVLGDKLLPSIRIETTRSFYDYKAKYNSQDTSYFCPSDLSDDQIKILNNLVMKAWRLTGCSGCGRVDVLLDDSGKFFLLEINTLPGMTKHSLVPMAAKAIGMSFEELVLNILKLVV